MIIFTNEKVKTVLLDLLLIFFSSQGISLLKIYLCGYCRSFSVIVKLSRASCRLLYGISNVVIKSASKMRLKQCFFYALGKMV